MTIRYIYRERTIVLPVKDVAVARVIHSLTKANAIILEVR